MDNKTQNSTVTRAKADPCSTRTINHGVLLMPVSWVVCAKPAPAFIIVLDYNLNSALSPLGHGILG
jgi:hypothetical protein